MSARILTSPELSLSSRLPDPPQNGALAIAVSGQQRRNCLLSKFELAGKPVRQDNIQPRYKRNSLRINSTFDDNIPFHIYFQITAPCITYILILGRQIFLLSYTHITISILVCQTNIS